MNKIIIEKLDSKTFDNQVIIKIAELLSDEYPDEFKSLKNSLNIGSLISYQEKR